MRWGEGGKDSFLGWRKEGDPFFWNLKKGENLLLPFPFINRISLHLSSNFNFPCSVELAEEDERVRCPRKTLHMMVLSSLTTAFERFADLSVREWNSIFADWRTST